MSTNTMDPSVDAQSVVMYGVIAGTFGLAGWLVWKRWFEGPLTGRGRNAPGFQTNVQKAWVPNPNAGKPIRGDIIERDDRHLYQSGTTSISYSNTSSSTPSPATNASKSYDDDWIPSSHKKATKGSKAVDSGADTETGGESEGPGAGKTKRRKGRR
ncbi:uncharacterized protein STEHIDRAFT_125099 [Stereum hirsutum FP-91666 SS1]|uniref:uncharacterized protein n=1 Tax=Stereum hirsutum (strain FP-91666) TaxID=721885 RepID=UPI0004449927|nr:uncharacterized protein STEHIDRAFT_125099 [Stereum hirsutum FP-91666 SS1]EIM81528.1 hypothetical protein STEHIDRAFT_125099 [Stereum hirsutum FP-91666 SS1]